MSSGVTRPVKANSQERGGLHVEMRGIVYEMRGTAYESANLTVKYTLSYAFVVLRLQNGFKCVTLLQDVLQICLT